MATLQRLSVWFFIIGLVFGSGFIPTDRLRGLSDNIVSQRFGQYYFAEMLTYYTIDEEPIAYAMVYKNLKDEPVTVVTGARLASSPIFEISKTLPNYYKNLDKAKTVVTQRLGTVAEFKKIYYFGPLKEYFLFATQHSEILVNTYSLRIFDKEDFLRLKPTRDSEIEEVLKQKWDSYLGSIDFFTRDTTIGYIDSVPFIDWIYGCSPTAASMILWYWDARGYGRLVDYFFTNWDEVEGEWNDCSNADRELAIAMYTDTMTGGTQLYNIGPGIVYVCNTINGYSFTSQTSSMGTPANGFWFSLIKAEIDSQRPVHWNVLDYQGQFDFDHSVTAVGYAYSPSLPDTFIIVHDTWTIAEPWWPLWTYANGYMSKDYVIRVRPGGPNPNNILLTQPLGGDVFNLPVMFKGLRYRLKWQTSGTDIDHIKIWFSRGTNRTSYDSLFWTVIDAWAPNTGEYIWTCTAPDCSLRINLAGLDLFDFRFAADGSFGRTAVRELSHSPQIDLVGHYDTPGWVNDLEIAGNLAFIADGTNGLVVADISDSSLPDDYAKLSLPGNAISIAGQGEYLYIGDREESLRVVSIIDPANPIQVGVLGLGDEARGLYATGNTVYVAARSQGLVIVDVSAPAAPNILGTFNTPGFAMDVWVDGNYAYVADATRGVRIVDISNPGAPVETGYYDTPGIVYGLTKAGSVVYAADGLAGIKIFDSSSPDTLILLGSFNTPGTATEVFYLNNYLFVADGSGGGIRVINVSNPSNPVEAGYMQGIGAGANIVVDGPMVYLADGGIGLLLLTQNFVGIEESQTIIPDVVIRVVPNIVRGSVMIDLNTQHKADAEITLYDCAGRYIKQVHKGILNAGNNRIRWEPEKIPAGVYFMKIRAGAYKTVQKLVLVE